MAKFQCVYITLNDGRRIVFTGPAYLDENDRKKGIKIIDIEFGEPEELPPGCEFGPLTKD